MKGIIIIILLTLSLTVCGQIRTDLCCNHYRKIDSLQRIEISLHELKSVQQDSIIKAQANNLQHQKKIHRKSLLGLTGVIFIILILTQ